MLSNQNGRRQGSVCVWLLSNFVPQFIFFQYLENYRESKLKVFTLFRTVFEAVSYDKARYFCKIFTYFWFYKFSSENIRRILITPKTKFTDSENIQISNSRL